MLENNNMLLFCEGFAKLKAEKFYCSKPYSFQSELYMSPTKHTVV